MPTQLTFFMFEFYCDNCHLTCSVFEVQIICNNAYNAYMPICFMQRPAGQLKSKQVHLILFKNTHVLCLYFRMDYEFIAKGFFFHKGRMKVTVSKLYKVGSFVITVDLLCNIFHIFWCLSIHLSALQFSFTNEFFFLDKFSSKFA